MKSDEKFTSLQALAVLAWADDIVTATERSKLIEFLCFATTLTYKEVEKVLEQAKTLKVDDIRDLRDMSLAGLSRLLSFGYAMTNLERQIKDSETEILRLIATASLDDDQWSDVQKWLIAKHTADALYDKVFSKKTVASA
jgi:hypothetical protein